MTTTMSEIALKMSRRAPGIVDRPAKPHQDADPACSICKGFGWKQSKVYDLNWFICSCAIETRTRAQAMQNKPDYSRMGMLEDELALTWSAIAPDISDALEGADAVRPAYDQGYGMVFLWGAWGQGKTLIGKILTATAIREGKRAAYANMSRVLDDIRLAFDERENKTTELLRRMEWWISRDVLFLDELDKVSGTAWAEERIFQLLDQRYVRAVREEALTVIASNKSDKDLDGYLRSRLNDTRIGSVVKLDGADGRQSMPKEWRY